MPIAYTNQRDNILVRLLINKVLELENLQEARMQAVETNGM